nr:hypothetical protein [Tanacetum cinerariifolium]
LKKQKTKVVDAGEPLHPAKKLRGDYEVPGVPLSFGQLFLESLIHQALVRIGKRERDEDKLKLLETTVGRVVLLLSITPDRSSGELEASVDKLFNEGGSGEQANHGDSAGGGHGIDV